MKLVLVGHSSGLLGAERSLLEIAQGAVMDGNEVAVLIPNVGPLQDLLHEAGAKTYLAPAFSWMGPKHHLFPLGLARYCQARLSVNRISCLLRELDPDVVVTNTSILPAAAMAARSLAIPHVWIVRESLATNRQLRSGLSKRFISRTIFENSIAICCISNFVSRQLLDLFPGDPRRIHLVSPRPMDSVDRAGRSIRLSPPLKLLLPGFFSFEKGQYRAIRALAVSRRAGTNAVLELVGTGSWLQLFWLRATAILLGVRRSVRFNGWQRDMASRYRQADMALMTSGNEAYGRTTAEALGFGIPVIGVNSGATPEVLRHGGGVLAAATITGLADAITRCANMSEDERRLLADEARAAGAQLASTPSQYDQLRSVLKEVRRSDSAA
ncbi:glycosyltransferase family 4 protein [Spongisporangium articulatum]|uniref:Glycosyltransferase family 4 protein n=1 Tax=Spongisporangium articulatum TaxID=3362603 RepID=A0ABW8ANB7_9ACTN